MNDAAVRRESAIAIWVVAASVVAHGCLAFAVAQSHGDAVRALVNRIVGGGV